MATKRRGRPAEPPQLPPNVTVIPTVKSVDPPAVVTYLQDLLDRARSGEVVSVVGVVFDSDGSGTYFCAGVDEQNDMFGVLGALRYAEANLLAQFVGGE